MKIEECEENSKTGHINNFHTKKPDYVKIEDNYE